MQFYRVCWTVILRISIRLVTAMRRFRPRKPRNAYRDPIWIRAVLRQWIPRLRLPDLDSEFLDAPSGIPAGSNATMLSAVPYVVSPVTWRGRRCQRKQVCQIRARIGMFSITSDGVTRAARMMRALPPSTTYWVW